MQNQRRNSEEFSKLLVRILVMLSIIISFFTIFFCFKFETIEPLTYLIPSIFTELAAGTGFYYWKAKSENKLKITISAIEKLKENEDLTESEIRLLEALINSLG